MVPFLCWVGLLLADQPDGVLHENVETFPPELLQRLLSRYYVCLSAVTTPSDHGMPVDRHRRLTWLVHKRIIQGGLRVQTVPSWSNSFLEQWYHRSCELNYRIWWALETGDFAEELEWAWKRSSSQAHGAPMPNTLPQCLTIVEADWVAKYARMCPDGAAIALSQNPYNQPMHNRGNAKGALHCHYGCFPTWSLPDAAWLTPLQSISSNCYVVDKSLSAFGESTSFCFERPDTYGPRARTATFEQAGDGMNLVDVGVALAWWLATMLPCDSGSSALLCAMSRCLKERPSNASLSEVDSGSDDSTEPLPFRVNSAAALARGDAAVAAPLPKRRRLRTKS